MDERIKQALADEKALVEARLAVAFDQSMVGIIDALLLQVKELDERVKAIERKAV